MWGQLWCSALRHDEAQHTNRSEWDNPQVLGGNCSASVPTWCAHVSFKLTHWWWGALIHNLSDSTISIVEFKSNVGVCIHHELGYKRDTLVAAHVFHSLLFTYALAWSTEAPCQLATVGTFGWNRHPSLWTRGASYLGSCPPPKDQVIQVQHRHCRRVAWFPCCDSTTSGQWGTTCLCKTRGWHHRFPYAADPKLGGSLQLSPPYLSNHIMVFILGHPKW